MEKEGESLKMEKFLDWENKTTRTTTTIKLGLHNRLNTNNIPISKALEAGAMMLLGMDDNKDRIDNLENRVNTIEGDIHTILEYIKEMKEYMGITQ